MKNSFIWVVGADGMLGSTLCTFLAKKGIKFICSTIQEADICIENQINKFVENKRLTHIINCAAYTQVDLAEKEKAKAFEVNAKAPSYLAKVAKEKKAKFIHFSTDYVFDGKKMTAYTEEDIPSPINVYGESKLQGEKAVLSEFSSACIIRTSWLFGRGKNNFVAKMLDLMQKKEKLSIVDDQIGRFTYAQDLVEATLNLVDQEGIFHFANQEQATWYEMVLYLYQKMIAQGNKLICKNINPVMSEEFLTIAKRPSYSILNTSKYENVAKTKARSWRKAVDAFLEDIER